MSMTKPKHHVRGLCTNAVHLCVDMQRMFAEPTEWMMPWTARVLPQVTALAECRPEKTIFTRFIPADRPGEGQGLWKNYYERWASMTVEQLGEEMLALVPALARLVPPASVMDKHVYSPWLARIFISGSKLRVSQL